MTLEGFSVKDWIGRLAQALTGLAEAHEPFLQKYWADNPRVHVVRGGRAAFPLDDLRDLYAMTRDGKIFGEEKYYAPLCAMLDPVRYILVSHPTLARVVSPIIGNDEFRVEILGSGGLTSLTDLIAGLMARAADRPDGAFEAAASELHAFLELGWATETTGVPGELDVGHDVVLFQGLSLSEEIRIADDISLLPFEEARAFVDESMLDEVAPTVVKYEVWQSVGAVVRPFRWAPEFLPSDRMGTGAPERPGPFFGDARVFLELIAIAHGVPVMPLVAIPLCTSKSACRLLGQPHCHGAYKVGRALQSFDPFKAYPGLRLQALQEAKKAFEERESARYRELAPIVGRLAEALARSGRFVGEVGIVEVATALEGMYRVGRPNIGRKLRDRASRYLGTDAERQTSIQESVGELYDTRSDIVHNRPGKLSPQRHQAVFAEGFDIARRSLFKLLGEGPPEDWDALAAGES